jgi:peptide/nickel transport system permease protein
LGVSYLRILRRHILPNIVTPLLVQGTFGFGVAILAQAALSYLGLGTQLPHASWDWMLFDAQTFIYNWACATIFLA